MNININIVKLANGYAAMSYGPFPGGDSSGKYFADDVMLESEIGQFILDTMAAAEKAEAESKDNVAGKSA